ncbi:unnamed protein product [Rotaria socialis]|uniref:Uncharacterized protein n=1 Tax=Rotaria socialis TaxID=392032 RepID=A0A818IGR4_9BILA|nr:unnamed protein product [Rotaria socialis]CAF3522366.1 unnamed protein product [Rotaria socialis]CAF3770737.1 unnamed protein product [Rotaria socialis]CAF4653995.1 unnamed protein product [Rotaria socialis]CAF4842049.1 unnamed protein product [Rotaria socialis]
MPTIFQHSMLLAVLIWHSIALPVDIGSKASLMNQQSERSLINHKISDIYNTGIHFLQNKTKNENKLRQKRDGTASVDIAAVQATVNDQRIMIDDHRTMIDDHRTLINNFLNTTSNENNIKQAVAEHHSSSPPIWNSWRDIGLVLLLFLLFVLIFYFCICHVKLKPCDYLISCIFNRYAKHQNKNQQKEHNHQESHLAIVPNKENMHHTLKPMNPPTYPNLHLTTIEDIYAACRPNGHPAT